MIVAVISLAACPTTILLVLIHSGLVAAAAQDQVPIPCKYFPTQNLIEVDGSGGATKIDIRADPLQFRPGEQAEYAKKCTLAAESPAPWLAVSQVVQVNADGEATIMIKVQPAKDIIGKREAILMLGTRATVYPGAPRHYANTLLIIRQRPLPRGAKMPDNAH
jgi:hypothetical protein